MSGLVKTFTGDMFCPPVMLLKPSPGGAGGAGSLQYALCTLRRQEQRKSRLGTDVMAEHARVLGSTECCFKTPNTSSLHLPQIISQSLVLSEHRSEDVTPHSTVTTKVSERQRVRPHAHRVGIGLPNPTGGAVRELHISPAPSLSPWCWEHVCFLFEHQIKWLVCVWSVSYEIQFKH